jgi:hypothetical protein
MHGSVSCLVVIKHSTSRSDGLSRATLAMMRAHDGIGLD